MSEGLNVNVDFQYTNSFQVSVSFSAKCGMITMLVGPSGSGKSTLLSLLCGLLDPLRGEIKVANQVLFCSKSSINVKPWNRGVGLLFQQDTLFPHLSVRKNLNFSAKPNVDSPWQFDSIAEAFELERLLERKPDQLSGGQRDRVALGRTLLAQPQLLLLDEPLGSVEDSLRKQIFEFVREGVERLLIPTLLVSHDSSLLSQFDGPTLEISGGKLVT